MRKLVLQAAAISVDGYICEEGTEFWRSFGPMAVPAAADDDELEELFLSRLRHAGTHIMGRVTYEAMAKTWPESTMAVAPIMNNTPKVVFSATLQTAVWPEARIARGDTAEEIARLKAEPGGPIVAHGGAKFLQSLASLGVVDEYWLYVYPVAVGSGTPLFTDAGQPRGLHLTSGRAFQSGVLALEYRPMTAAELQAIVPVADTGPEAHAAYEAELRATSAH